MKIFDTSFLIIIFLCIALFRNIYGFQETAFVWANHNNVDGYWKSFNWNIVKTIGFFGSLSEQPLNGMLEYAHERGVKVVSAAGLGDLNVSDPNARSDWISNEINKALSGGYDGINIDYEGNSPNIRDGFNLLVIESADSFHEKIPGSEVSIDAPIYPTYEGRNYDYISFADHLDYMFIMAYDDEFWLNAQCIIGQANCSLATAPYPAIEFGIQQYLDIGFPGSKLYLGLPWYGIAYEMVAKVPFIACQLSVSDIQTLMIVHKEKGELIYHEVDKVYQFKCNSLCNPKSLNQKEWYSEVWFDDSTTLLPKYQLAVRYGLKGVGMWDAGKLDYQPMTTLSRDMWQAISSYNTPPTLYPLKIVQTEEQKDRLRTLNNGLALDLTLYPIPTTSVPHSINIDLDIKYQTLQGFGGAFTDSTAWLYNQLSEDKKQEVMSAYFGENGHKYTFCRLQIGSSDFAVSHYNYNNFTGDYHMENFTIDHDREYIIPMIQDALKTASTRIKDKSIQFISTPWSPPAWLKRNNRMVNSFMPGLIQDNATFTSWALYLSKYVTAYKAAGVPISHITIQNEPHVAKQFAVTYECCGFEPTHERDFLRDFLGPRLRMDHPDLKIYIHDDQKDDVLIDMVNTIMSDNNAAEFVDGIAFHWYDDFLENYDVLDSVHEMFPDLPLLGTEATLMRPKAQNLPWNQGKWTQGQYYAIDIIRDLNHYATGWIDWNMLLDRQGGPSSQHLGGILSEKELYDLGNCDSPIRLNLKGFPYNTTESGDGSLIYGSAYWHYGHFTRFLSPGSIRVMSNSSSSSTTETILEYVAFQTPSNELVIIVLNAHDEATSFALNVPSYGSAIIDIPAQGIQTIILNL